MGNWTDKLRRAFTMSPQQRYTEIRAQQQAAEESRLSTRGQWFRCPTCDWFTTAVWVAKHGGKAPEVCPICLTHADGTPPSETQVTRTYARGKNGVGNDIDAAFAHEAAQMARAGWRVQSQAYGGLGVAGAGTLAEITFTGSSARQAAGRKPELVTVVYVRE